MKSLALFLGTILSFSTFVRGQDIQNSGPIVLPQAPATQYVITSGQTISIKSRTSVTLLPGTHLQEGSNVSIKITNNQLISPAPSNPADDYDKNWIISKNYDDDGNLLSETKSFFDYNGNTIQSQVKNLSAGHVLATQEIYDAKERIVGSSLLAPVNNSAFAYKTNFMNTASGEAYTYKHFDKIPYVFDKINTPDAVGNNTEGTLGWYYSNNNVLEPHVAVTGFPYSRSDFYDDGTEALKRSATVGDELRIGKGNEESSNIFPVVNELDNYVAVRNKFFPVSLMGAAPVSMKGKAKQVVSIDQNGHQMVMISDLEGKNLMTARVGDEQGLLSVTNTVNLDPVNDLYIFGLKMENANGGAKSFTVSSIHNITVYKDGVFQYFGKGNNYPGYAPATVNGEEIRITSDHPFYVSYKDYLGQPACDDCPSRITEPEGSSVHYFQLFQPSNVSTSGSYSPTLYDMSKVGVSAVVPYTSMSPLAKGYYKLASSLTSASLTYTNKYADISYNFYNGLGQLVATIAPEGVKALITNGLGGYTSIQDVPYTDLYEYDLQGRLLANTTTDAGRTEYAYREDGNIRFSQNAEQVKTGRFSYVNYDRWGRSIESGEYLNANLSFATAKADENLKNSTNLDGGLTGGSRTGWVKTHYDEPNSDHGLAGYIQDEAFLKGISWTENEQNKTWYNYDADGRVVWVVKSINGLGTKTIDYSYNASGNVTKVDFQKDNSVERFIHEYEYDADSRLKVVYTSTSGSVKKEQARYYYYLHGSLKRVELAENLQGLDYTYTPQGWLKSINHPIAGSDPGADGVQNGFSPDAFAMTMEYFNGDYVRNNTGISSLATGGQASYNGNIMGQSWKSLKPQAVISSYGIGVNNPAMVTYAYDDKYQFDSNKYGAPNFGSNSFTESLNANREHNLSYDANGNIKTLNRTNSSGASTAAFNYTYQSNTNKLTGVDNYASYSYDALGQMASQQKVNGQGHYVEYDVNGKVAAVYSDAAKTQLRISFGYDEAGLRIRKTDHIQNVVTYYVHDASGNVLAIYDNKGTTLLQKEVPVYASSRIGIYNRPGNSYQYELTDHLGNVRVVINGSKQGNGDADVVYYADYYPYGSPLTYAANDYRYGYQGQYAEVDKETGWNSFELRMYDPEIGRWMNVDPYAEFYSPYVGMGNNPVASVDPDGGKIDPDPPTKSDGITLKEVVITAGKGFMGGASSTWDFMKNQWTWKGYGEGLANTFTLGMYGSVQTLRGLYNVGKNIPTYTTKDYIYGGFFAVEKVAEALIFKRVTSIATTRLVARGIVVEAETVAAKTVGNSSKVLLNTSRQLQAKFKHASDFGVVGNYNKANASKFSSALNQHINASGTQIIQGAYRNSNNPVTFYLNPQTGLNVIASPSGQFISGAALSPTQVQGILTKGFLW